MNRTSASRLLSFRHPGAERRQAKAAAKERIVDPGARDEVESLLSDLSRRNEIGTDLNGFTVGNQSEFGR